MELTPEYIKAVRFTVKRGNTYDAAEVDAFFKPYRAHRNERNRRMVAAVRSHRYRSEERLLDDPEAVKRLSADPRVREAVLSAHLAGIYKSAAALPAFIDDGGNIPVAEPVKGGMDRAKAKLTAMLAGGR